MGKSDGITLAPRNPKDLLSQSLGNISEMFWMSAGDGQAASGTEQPGLISNTALPEGE